MTEKKTAETIFGLPPEILCFGCGVRPVLSTVSGDLLDDVESSAVLAAQFLRNILFSPQILASDIFCGLTGKLWQILCMARGLICLSVCLSVYVSLSLPLSVCHDASSCAQLNLPEAMRSFRFRPAVAQ